MPYCLCYNLLYLLRHSRFLVLTYLDVIHLYLQSFAGSPRPLCRQSPVEPPEACWPAATRPKADASAWQRI